MKTMSLADFKHQYYTKFPNSSYRLGQHFLNVFIEDSTPYYELWNERDPCVQNSMIWKICLDLCWDVGKLQVLRADLL